MVTRSKLLAHYGNVVWVNANMRTDASANATSNGGDASRVGKRSNYLFSRVHIFLFSLPRRETRRPH